MSTTSINNLDLTNSNNNLTKKYDELKNNIVSNIVVPNLEKDATMLSIWRIRWRNIANTFETMVKILIGISTVLAYSSGYYSMPILAYFAGLAGTIALVFGEFASYCKKESHERTTLFNRLLTYMNISPIPDTTEDDSTVPNEYGTKQPYLDLHKLNSFHNIPTIKLNVDESKNGFGYTKELINKNNDDVL